MNHRIPLETMRDVFLRNLVNAGFERGRALRCASIFADNSAAGVSSHGLNRFPEFIDFVRKGFVNPVAEMTCTARFGAWEQWHGHLGPGPLNACDATNRAMVLARRHGIGCVGLQQTNHWMRGGYYGWIAAEKGMAFMAWTNTKPNMPPWGATDCHLGNNPLVLAVPRPSGPVVLDMAMSQFSFGRLETYLREGKLLPVAGGYDADGVVTTDPGAILNSNRVLPIGCWKGAGLAMLLDSLAALVSGGDTTRRIGQRDPEYGVSQVFIAVDVTRAGASRVDGLMDELVADLQASRPDGENGDVRYPGQRIREMHRESLEKGVPVDPDIWEQVVAGL
ncbi:MAG: 3-dehydro-L-gulonate 2-dehydrogenase [Deltaproteobacteria bacterium]|nr:3-dehydro-L-gulonate 2-dehydrogenase [Deltaproteobacteria bacterium]